VRYRRVYTDRRGHLAVAGFVVVSTNHSAASANGPALHRRFELDGGMLTVPDLPPNMYSLHAELTGETGEQWSEQEYLTVEDE
jgi:hypothetical protein